MPNISKAFYSITAVLYALRDTQEFFPFPTGPQGPRLLASLGSRLRGGAEQHEPHGPCDLQAERPVGTALSQYRRNRTGVCEFEQKFNAA